MPMLEWNDALSLSVERIDNQHKRLVEMVNRLHDAMTSGENDALPGIVGEMGRYALEHFATEEEYMDRYAYPDGEAHKAEHRDFTAKTGRIAADVMDGKAALSMEVLNFLGDWLVTHIAGTDARLGAFLRARNTA